jgi:aromatic ring-cleaving dioxygenase
MFLLPAILSATPTVTVNNITIHCWHIHVYFMERNNASVDRALSLRADFLRRFVEADAQPCAAEVTTDRICVWPGVNMQPTGPHTYGSWGASMPNDRYNEVMPWVQAAAQQPRRERGNDVCMAQHGALAGLLLHPLTAARGEDTRESRRLDHELGLWSVRVLPLDFDFLWHNVYDCDACDPEYCTQACR